MSTYVALIEPTDKNIFHTNGATQSTRDGTAVAEKHGIKIENFYWTSGPCNAVLVLQAADKQGINGWRASLKNLRVQVIPAVQDPNTISQTTNDQWGSSCGMIPWWY